MTAPTESSSTVSVWSQSIAPDGQARTQESHSEQTAQLRQRCASATASSAVYPRLTSAQSVRRRHPVDHRHRHALAGLDGGQLLVGRARLGAGVVPDGQQALAAQVVVDGGGAAAAGGDRLDGRVEADGRRVAAGEDALAGRHHRVAVDADLAVLQLETFAAPGEVVDQRLADGEDHRVGGELELGALDGDRLTPTRGVGLAELAAL